MGFDKTEVLMTVCLFEENFMGVEKKKVEKNHGNVEKVTVRKQKYNYRNFGESRDKGKNEKEIQGKGSSIGVEDRGQGQGALGDDKIDNGRA